jgi:hypothetical protein
MLSTLHLRMRPHVSQESQPFDDTVVQVDEFRLGQLVDIDLHAHLIEDKARSRRRLTKLPNARRPPSPFADVGWTHLLGRVTRMNPHSYPRLDLR